MEKKRTLLARWTIEPRVMAIAWPVLLELLLSSLFVMVDMIMLGNIRPVSLSAASIASVGITNQPLFIGLSLVQSFNVGGTAIIARYFGMGRLNRLGSVFHHVVLLSVVLILLPLFAFAMIFAEPIMRFLGAQEDVILVGSTYFRIMHVGFLFQGLTMCAASAMRGVGETKVPMKVNLFCNGINVIGNAVLIYGLFGLPALGVVGAGISSAASQLLAFFLIYRHLLSARSPVTIKNKFSFSYVTVKNLLRIGLPASLEQLALRLGIFFFVRIVASLGTLVYAAHQIALSILGLSFTPGQAFGIAASTLVGQSLGEGNPKEAQLHAKSARRIGSIISSGIAVLFFFFGADLVRLYTPDEGIIRNAAVALKVIALVQPFQSSQLILSGALRGAGDTLWPLIATVVGVLIIRLSLASILVHGFALGLFGAWVAVFIDQFIRWAFVQGRFQSGKWKLVRIR
ncbi:Na+ driven multidrug efflux pump [Clostridiaceae bacterium JG1575]|nr:Na+ driven multidrug efflux pump [Clostridiaceae bacterium JG1575]